MNLVFQLAKRPDLTEAQRLSQTLDQERGVTSALVDPQLARIFVTFDPDLTGDLALQSVVERMGYRIAREGEPLAFMTETPGYLSEVQTERSELDAAIGMVRDAEFELPEAPHEVHYGSGSSGAT